MFGKSLKVTVVLGLGVLVGCSAGSFEPDTESVQEAQEAVVVALPARIEAESYERYFETTPGTNSGGKCDRGDGVDKELTQDPNGGNCNIGWTAPNEWLEYDVNTTTTGTFTLTARVASGAANTSFRILLDGTDLGSRTATTGGWQTWQDRTYNNVTLPAGNHVIRVLFETNDVNLNYITLTAATPTCSDGVQNGTETGIDCGGSCPACSTVALPARIEAELYTRYFESTPGSNSGGQCDRGDGVDKQLAQDPNGGNCNIGWTTPGEWLEYDVSTATTRNFKLTARIASGAANTSFRVLLDGASLGSLTASTGGWQVWQDRTYDNVSISAGNHVLRVVFDTNDVNLNYLDVATTSTPTCSDGVKNGSETGVDCGGGTCPSCSNGQICSSASDCQSGFCNSGVCRAALPWWISYCSQPSCGGSPFVARICPDNNPSCSPASSTTVVPEIDGQQINQILLPVQPPTGYSVHYESGSGSAPGYILAYASPVIIRSDVNFTVSYYNVPAVLGGTTHVNFQSATFNAAEVLTTVYRHPTFLTGNEPSELHQRGRDIIVQESSIAGIHPGKMNSYFLPSELATFMEGNVSDGNLHIAINYGNPAWIAGVGDVYATSLPRFAHEYTHELFSEIAQSYPGNNVCFNEGLADAFAYAAGFLPEADFGPLGQMQTDFNQGCAETMAFGEVHEVGNCPLWQVKRLSRMTSAFAAALLHPQHVINFDSCNLNSSQTGNALLVLFSEAAGMDMTQAIQMAEIPNAGSYTAARAALGL
jgi:hypothetical protein